MKGLLILFTLFIGAGCFSQDKNPLYYKLKEGVFYTTHINKKGEQDTLIVRRTKNVQTESSLKNGKEKILLKLKVVWIKDSKYILRRITHVNNSKSFITGDIMCKIIETGNGYYIVKAWEKKGKKMLITLYTYN